MADNPRSTAEEFDTKAKQLIEKNGYTVMDWAGRHDWVTATYRCTREDMEYWVKLAAARGDAGKDEEGRANEDVRMLELKNEVAALDQLWQKYPGGETDAFILPPGPETIFDQVLDGSRVFGYARLQIDGAILGNDLRKGVVKFSDWLDRYVKIVKTIDSLPQLELPKTAYEQKVDRAAFVREKAETWTKELKEYSDKGIGGVTEELVACAEKVALSLDQSLAGRSIVCGTVHGDLVPDHIVYSEGLEKPYLVNFTRLNHCYPRFWDIAMVFGWVEAVLGDVAAAKAFWSRATDGWLDKGQSETLRMFTNLVSIGMLVAYLDPKQEGGTVKAGCERFM